MDHTGLSFSLPIPPTQAWFPQYDSGKGMVHLLPHWNWADGAAIDVWAFSNAASVELFVNGISHGALFRLFALSVCAWCVCVCVECGCVQRAWVCVLCVSTLLSTSACVALVVFFASACHGHIAHVRIRISSLQGE